MNDQKLEALKLRHKNHISMSNNFIYLAIFILVPIVSGTIPRESFTTVLIGLLALLFTFEFIRRRRKASSIADQIEGAA